MVIAVYPQNLEIRGRIIDKNTEYPVAEAHVTTGSGVVSITDASGYFNLTVTGIPATLRITHVSYGAMIHELTTMPKDLLVIRISQAVTGLKEVQISGNRLRVLTQKEPFSIQEFAIDQDVIWFLGFINNQANQKRLFMANLYGDTLASIPVKGAERLFQDVFRNVHIVFRDSVCQLYHSEENRPELIYPEERSNFFSLMGDINLSLGQKLIYSKEATGSHLRAVYYIQQNDPVRYLLTLMVDSLEAGRQNTVRKIDLAMARFNVPELANMWTEILRYSKRGTRFESVIFKAIPFGLFKSNNELFIVNYLKDSLLNYSDEGKFLRALPISFHKANNAGGILYKDLTYLTDPLTQKVYVLEKKISSWTLNPLDPSTGQTEAEIRLPDLPGMDGISVHDHAVYFIYQEKNHPYYNRLYRYQL